MHGSINGTLYNIHQLVQQLIRRCVDSKLSSDFKYGVIGVKFASCPFFKELAEH